MKATVSNAGVLIPRSMLRGVKEVEICKDGRNILVTPATAQSDPIFNLGKHPVRIGVADGAEQHDAYLYNGS